MNYARIWKSMNIRKIGLMGGPILALGLHAAPSFGLFLDPAKPELNSMAAIAVLMAIWWLTEAVPLAATALMPLVLFPLLKIMPHHEVASEYGHHFVFLFLGGFIIALAVEESGLHRRVALTIVAAMGGNPRFVIGGFMLATAVLSMWLANTATTMMMLPIAAGIVDLAERGNGDLRKRRNFGVALMLGIAYAASIGGMATLIGTPPNLALVSEYEKQFAGPGIGFFAWMKLAVPLAGMFLILAWATLVFWVFPVDKIAVLGEGNHIADELDKLGPMTTAQWRMAIIFTITALLWIFREPVDGFGWAPLLGVNAWAGDGTSAILMAVVCFFVPSDDKPDVPMLQWKATERLPWGILLLFGGGLALAKGMSVAGLDMYLANWLCAAIEHLPDWGKSLMTAFCMTWLTELTSNLASVQMFMPILAETAKSLGMPPLLLMLPATFAASCAFMLPVATPPNAIIFGSGRVKIGEMMKAGVWLNLVGVVWIVLCVWLLGSFAFGKAAMFVGS